MASPVNASAIETRLKVPPDMAALFVPKTRQRLQAFISKPFNNKNFSTRVFINGTASLKAYLYKAYHTGKGDDFESIAVIITNPNLPMDCSKMGVFGQKPAPAGTRDEDRSPAASIASADLKTKAALWVHGGHFFTFQIDARPDTTAEDEKFGKGVFPVQLDYVIIRPPEVTNGRIIRQAEVIILEFKGGPDQRIMAVQEAVQLNKGYKFFKRMYGPGNVVVKLFYVPYLATNPMVWGPKMPASFQNVDFLSLSGLSKVIGVPVDTIERWGSLRAHWLRQFDARVNALTEAVLAAIQREANKNAFLTNLQTKRGPVFRIPNRPGGTTIDFSNILNPSLTGGSNMNWKNRHQKLTRALATREYLKQEINAASKVNQAEAAKLKNQYNRYTHAIKTLDKLRPTNTGILTTPMRTRINAAWARLGTMTENFVNRALMSPSMNRKAKYMGSNQVVENARDAEFTKWLGARQHMLRGRSSQWPNTSRLEAGKDVYSPRSTPSNSSKIIGEIIEAIGHKGNNNKNVKIASSLMTKWVTALQRIQQGVPPDSPLGAVCDELLITLSTRSMINNARRAPPTAAARSFANAVRGTVEGAKSLYGGINFTSMVPFKAGKAPKEKARTGPYSRPTKTAQAMLPNAGDGARNQLAMTAQVGRQAAAATAQRRALEAALAAATATGGGN